MPTVYKDGPMTVMTIVMFIGGVATLVFGADVLVRGASKIATAIGISPLVVGLTVVAYGTSAPELAVSVQASMGGQPDLAIGNIVGSNISNILLILGLSALVAPLVVAQQLIRLDVPLMIGVFVAMFAVSVNGIVSTVEGWLLFAGAIGYTVFAIRKSRKETLAIQDAYEKEFGSDRTSGRRPWKLAIDVALVVVGSGLLVLGSDWLVESAIVIAQHFGVSELVIGLTIVSIGTSLPELATSIVASIKGERDIAVGNVVGSNIFNVLAVLGLTAVVVPVGVPVAQSIIAFDLPIMLAVGFACLPIFVTGYRIERWEGAFFLFYYGAYLTFLVMKATQHDALPFFSQVMAFFVVPLAAVTLAVIVFRAIQQKVREP
jgi:cation:H+ antiporter